MAQDFAKKKRTSGGQRKSARNATRVDEPINNTSWPWFFSGLFFGLFLAFIAFLALDRPEQRVAAQQASADSASTETGDDARSSFDFYNYLPEATVQVDVVPVALRNEPADDSERYLLQAGSFQDRQDAESRRASVILLNLDAQVVPGVVGGKTWHRVQVGPFEGRRAAESARSELSSNNIDTIVLRVQ